MRVVDRSFDNPLEAEEAAVMPLAGGIIGYGYQCGMLWGAALAAGARAYNLYGAGPEAEVAAIEASQKCVEKFRLSNKHIYCLEISELNLKGKMQLRKILKFFFTAHFINCFRMAAKYAKEAFKEINSVLNSKQREAASVPVSCPAILARKMGASDMHAVMAAGFAGGIGLCGGACGALGAAIWLSGIKNDNGKPSMKFDDPGINKIIDKFLRNTDFKFECSEICGRKFTDAEEHAEYLRNGGCSKIIDLLATIIPAGKSEIRI